MNETLLIVPKKLVSDVGSTNPLIRTLILATIVAVIGRLAYRILRAQYEISKIPLVNGRKPWSFSVAAEELNFKQNAGQLIEQGFKTAGKAFRLQTDNGVHVILSAEYADSIRNHPHANLPELTAVDFHSGIPGFDAWTMVSAKDRMIVNTIKEHLTQRRALLYPPLSKKSKDTLELNWSNNTEWHDISLPETALQLIARTSSLVLLGPELCDNQEWVPYVVSYIATTHSAMHALSKWPRVMRPLAHWFLPSCKALRADFDKCAGLINPVLEERRRDKKARIAKGLKPKEYLDAMEWLEEMNSGKDYNPTAAHVTFAIAGIFSSTDTLTQVIYDLCGQPQLIEDLRKEIISVVSKGPWEKKSFFDLKLLDSVMKETQRLKPIAMASMHRLATGDIDLPDGTRLPKGTRFMVSAHQSWDESIYPNADKFDGYRFLRLREEGAKLAQFATTSPSTIGFGHGHWACPARVFASDEIKIALCHILLMYDFKMASDDRPKPKIYGFVTQADTNGRIMVRRRKEEISL
ncbi:Cytochrome P450 monooxygenase adrA [Paramyrothecium foliicola]|nr:Cytochrome P450 monooxygenase adrA [Paramyrothecium foliicola]